MAGCISTDTRHMYQSNTKSHTDKAHKRKYKIRIQNKLRDA